MTPPPADTTGLLCRHCGCRHFVVYSTRRRANSIQRVRVCRNCGARVITNERPAGESTAKEGA